MALLHRFFVLCGFTVLVPFQSPAPSHTGNRALNPSLPCPAVCLTPQGTTFGAPAPLPPGSPLPAVAQGVQKLLDVMVDNGYALQVRQGTALYDRQHRGQTAELVCCVLMLAAVCPPFATVLQ